MSAVPSRPADVAESLFASLTHIERIAERRETLTRAQSEAEEQFIFRVAQEHRSVPFSDIDLLRIYRRLRRDLPTPDLGARWRGAGLPSVQTLLGRTSGSTRLPNSTYGWEGSAPLLARAPAPGLGQSVVYVLFDAMNVPCYVGSTRRFRDRLKTHLRDGKPVACWTAFPVSTRDEAYRLEDRLLREHKPYLNRRAGR